MEQPKFLNMVETTVYSNKETHKEFVRKSKVEDQEIIINAVRYGITKINNSDTPLIIDALSTNNESTNVPNVFIRNRQENEFLVTLNKRSKPVKNYTSRTQTWIGYITSIKEDSFTARLKDLTNPSPLFEETELENIEVPVADKELFKEGGIFYWSLGYEYQSTGQLEKKSIIRFKRSVGISSEKFDLIHEDSKALARQLKFE